MKVGDIVRYVEAPSMAPQGADDSEPFPIGIIINGPHPESRMYQVWWLFVHRSAWWNKKRLELVNESR